MNGTPPTSYNNNSSSSSSSDSNRNSFSICELSDPRNKLAARARNPRNPYGKLLYEVFPLNVNAMIYDRWNVEKPHAQVWAEGIGEFYVSTDVTQIQICPLSKQEAEEVRRKTGQYYKSAYTSISEKAEDEWEYFAQANQAPMNVGGYHKAVIDTKQPDSEWILSARLVSTAISGMKFEGCAQFAAISRVDYKGFLSSSDPTNDQCRNHLKVCEIFRLESGKILIQDAKESFKDMNEISDTTLATNTFPCADIGTTMNNRHDRGSNNRSFSMLKNLPRSVHTPMDGFFPIQFHYDNHGKIDMIMIQFI